MEPAGPLRKLSIKTKLIFSYLVILAVGGMATSLVGSWIVSTAIMRQAQWTADQNLATARTIYRDELATLQRTVELASSGSTIQHYVSSRDRAGLIRYLGEIRTDAGFDFLTLTDAMGRTVLRSTELERFGDDVSHLNVVRAALQGRAASATEVLEPEDLAKEDAALPEQARFRVVATPRAAPAERVEERTGLVLMAAAPVYASGQRLLGALYGGVLLDRNLDFVDRVWRVLYEGETYQGQNVGSVTIFEGDVRIATTVETAEGERALGTRVSQEVRNAVLDQGGSWNDRAFVVRDWYISSYEPIQDYEGRVVGILYVGLLEARYTAIRNQVIFSFFGIAGLGFILIIAITYGMIHNITSPLAQVAAAARNIADGDFDQKVDHDADVEIGTLAQSFNFMAASLRQMRSDLEEWGRTLEEKVEQRTEELLTMQARVARSERLASLGMLSAGVAHEINNPLGGILALTALTLEDLPAGHPDRENLQEVVTQAQRCKDIVKGLLEFSRQSQASAELLELNAVVDETLRLVCKQAAFFNVDIVKDFIPGLPPIMANKSELQQVLLNIVMNASQAMGEQGTLTLATRMAEEDSVELTISDTGHGIPPEQIEHVFDPFFTTKSQGEGTGLGLSIAFGIVTKHRGTISVESEVGRGTRFTIRLPAAPAFAERSQS
jgi:two-component system NtrC family sensor kinase